MPDFIDNLRNNINSNINDKITVRTGEITAVNDDGTYDVKIAQSDSAYPDVETIDYNAQFSKGEIVDIIFEYGNKESPKIVGTAKKIAQDPKEVEVDYSGDGGKQTETVTVNSEGETSDACLAKQDLDYDTAHDAESADIAIDIISYEYIGIGYVYAEGTLDPEQWEADWYHTLYRGYLLFDTSSIPTDATITSAVLYIYKIEVASTSDNHFDIVIQNGQPTYPHNPPVLGDYNKSYYSNNGGSINTNSLNTDAYSTITLNSNGRAWINKGGMTKLCLRSSREIAGISWDTAETEHLEILGIWAAEKGEGYRPKLEITYDI